MRQPSSGQDGYPYPPQAGPYNNNDYANSMSTFGGKTLEEGRGTGRTPSPTPSEEKELQSGAINWTAMMNWRFWFRRAWLCALTSLTSPMLGAEGGRRRVLCYWIHPCGDHCVGYALSPADCALVDASNAVALRVGLPMPLTTLLVNTPGSLRFGWLVPIGILFVISFPPVRHFPYVGASLTNAAL